MFLSFLFVLVSASGLRWTCFESGFWGYQHGDPGFDPFSLTKHTQNKQGQDGEHEFNTTHLPLGPRLSCLEGILGTGTCVPWADSHLGDGSDVPQHTWIVGSVTFLATSFFSDTCVFSICSTRGSPLLEAAAIEYNLSIPLFPPLTFTRAPWRARFTLRDS